MKKKRKETFFAFSILFPCRTLPGRYIAFCRSSSNTQIFLYVQEYKPQFRDFPATRNDFVPDEEGLRGDFNPTI